MLKERQDFQNGRIWRTRQRAAELAREEMKDEMRLLYDRERKAVERLMQKVEEQKRKQLEAERRKQGEVIDVDALDAVSVSIYLRVSLSHTDAPRRAFFAGTLCEETSQCTEITNRGEDGETAHHQNQEGRDQHGSQSPWAPHKLATSFSVGPHCRCAESCTVLESRRYRQAPSHERSRDIQR